MSSVSPTGTSAQQPAGVLSKVRGRHVGSTRHRGAGLRMRQRHDVAWMCRPHAHLPYRGNHILRQLLILWLRAGAEKAVVPGRTPIRTGGGYAFPPPSLVTARPPHRHPCRRRRRRSRRCHRRIVTLVGPSSSLRAAHVALRLTTRWKGSPRCIAGSARWRRGERAARIITGCP
jgi:hypothetical protein